MNARDTGRFAWGALTAHRARTLLIAMAISIGVAAVVVLTSLGEGARLYVRQQFEQLGTNVIIVFPGRTETFGGTAGMMSGRTTRDLTLDDALALRRIRGVVRVAPGNLAAADLSWGSRRRDVTVLGSTNEVQYAWKLQLSEGRFLPAGDPRADLPLVVIGQKLRREIFGAAPPLGQWVRIGDRRFRVIGILAPKGQAFGFDFDEIAIIPVASAQNLFNLRSLLRIVIEVEGKEAIDRVRREARRMLAARHGGEEDVTMITEDAVSTAFDRVFVALTFALGGIAAISLGVAGILIMNVMLITVTQRTTEIGLLKALGATPRQIRMLFLAEAAVLSAIGGVFGSVLGQAGSLVVRRLYPMVPAFAPAWAVVAAFATAIVTGIGFTFLPARRAARLDPAMALARR